MLTADLVRGRVQGGCLVVRRFDARHRASAIELAEAVLTVAREQVGTTREELREAWEACGRGAGERKLLQGLCKLVEDGASFTEADSEDSVGLRRAVFRRASAARRVDDTASWRAAEFDRGAVLASVAAERGTTVAAIEAALYADLRGAQALLAVPAETPAALVERYERASVQAVLLRAVRVVADVWCGPQVARAIFHRLKFHRLLHQIDRIDNAAYRITIDGPYSLFDAVTKYGLELALVLPVLEAADRLELEADIRWGTERRPLVFRHSVRHPPRAGDQEVSRLGTEAEELMAAFRGLDTHWGVEPASTVLDLPGAGLVVPDLRFSHPDLEGPVFLEVLGYWSRAAVWRRIELVEAGLPYRILFAVSSRLRVSEEVLEESYSARLYVFKGMMSARAVERKLEALLSDARSR
ncbi:MAG: DUF790 family protein [Polyangiaceae bacterium]|nr:DUF790 family protein [Polyangiaceae bacterium]